jgi:hypothetical protein
MNKPQGKRRILDDLVDGAREILDALDRLINGDKRRRPVPIPIPVENERPRDPRYPR